MKIEHVALWTADLERLKTFYEQFFNARANQKYINPKHEFESYFLTFESGARLEIMTRASVQTLLRTADSSPTGYAHIAFALGSRPAVDQLTAQLVEQGYGCLSGPRLTGDGYYESVVLDPDGNVLELTE